MKATDLAALHAQCFDEAPRPWSVAEFEEVIASNRQFILCAEGGFAVVQVIADQAELLTIAVAPEARRMGVASGLLREVLDRSAALGAVDMFLEVDATNMAARGLYARHGFSISGQRKNYYRRADGVATDALVMVRSLVTPRHG